MEWGTSQKGAYQEESHGPVHTRCTSLVAQSNVILLAAQSNVILLKGDGPEPALPGSPQTRLLSGGLMPRHGKRFEVS